MAKKGSFSKVYDKNGDYVDVEAARFDGTRTFQMQGDVTASQTWNGDPSSPLTLNASIGAKKVTTDKINDKAVGTAQLADDAVGLTQIDDNAMTSAATSGDDRLITSGGVRTEIDNALLNRGVDYPPMTPAQINAITDTIPTGSTVHVTEAGTITDGDIVVRAGEDLRYYRGNGEHYWYSLDGDFKLKQQAKTSPTASGSTLEFIDSITQDENGEITASKKAVQDGTTSQKGVVQLAGSIGATVDSENNKAASEKAVRDAINAMNAETTANKVTSVRNVTTATDTAYPSELAVRKAINAVKTSGISNGHTGGTIFLTVNCSSLDFYNTEIEISIAEASGGKGFTFVSAPRYVGNSFSGLLKVVNGVSDYIPIRCLNWTDENGKRYFGFAATINGSFRFSFSAIGPDSHVGRISISDTALSSVTEISRLTVRNCVSAENNTAVGSTSVPTYVDAKGNVQACTDDFVHDSEIASMADKNKVVAIADARIDRNGTDGWFKFASRAFNSSGVGLRFLWIVSAMGYADNSQNVTFFLNLSIGFGSSGGNPSFGLFETSPIKKDLIGCDFKAIVNGTVGNATIELWAKVGSRYGSVAIRELQAGNFRGADAKGFLTYTSYAPSDAGSSEEPTGNVSKKLTFVYAQGAIASPTNNNIVAMDANGLVKDSGKNIAELKTKQTAVNDPTASGTALSFIDSITQNENGEITPTKKSVTVDSTPTANSDNPVSSGGVKNALDSVSSNVYPWFRVAANGTTKLFKVCDIILPSTTSYFGSRYIFDFAGEFNGGNLPTVSGRVEVRIRTSGSDASPIIYMRVTYNSGMYASTINATFKVYYKYDSDAKKFYAVLAIQAGGTTYNGYRCRINSCYQQDGTSCDRNVTTVSSITEYTPEEGYSEETTNVSVIGNVYYSRSAVGSAGVPVYVNANGAVTTCTVDSVPTANSTNLVTSGGVKSALDAKQDSLPTSGTASDSYAINITGNAATATKPSFVTLTSSDDLNNIKGSERGDILEYVWLNTSIPSNVPVSGSSGILLVVNKGSLQYTKQICFVPGSNRIWCRYQTNGSWGTWAQFLETRDVKSTYSSSGTDPVDGTAVAAALATLDVADSAETHKFVTAVSETDGKVSITRVQPVIADVDGLQTALDGKEGSITWMTEQEARSIWANAKAAVAAS